MFYFFQYYYNSSSNQFLYWDGELKTYLPAPADSQTPDMHPQQTDMMGERKEPEKKDKDKKEKVKIAKKIAKVIDTVRPAMSSHL